MFFIYVTSSNELLVQKFSEFLMGLDCLSGLRDHSQLTLYVINTIRIYCEMEDVL